MKNQDWLDIGNDDVKNEYLKMPRSFSDRVDECVKEQMEDAHVSEDGGITPIRGKKTKQQRRVFSWTKAAACVVVAVFVIGGTAMAATHFHLSDLIFGNEVPDSEVFEEHVQVAEGIGQQVESELPEVLSWVDTSGDQDFEEQLLQIQEVYFDGSTLYVYGEATEAGKAYDLYSARFIINGQQYETDFKALASSEHYFQGDDKPEQDAPDAVKEMYEVWISKDKTDIDRYFGAVQLADLGLSEDFTVELPLSVYRKNEGRICLQSGVNGNIQREYRSDGEFVDNNREFLFDLDYPLRYNNLADEDLSRLGMQTISFHVSVMDNKAEIVEPQWIDAADGRVWLDTLTIAPSTTYIKFQWYMEGEDAEEKIQELSTAYLEIMDENGNAYNGVGVDYGGTPTKTAVFEESEGVWYTEKKVYLDVVPMDVQSLTIKAYQTESDEDDVQIHVGDELEYASFTVTIE